MASCHAGQCLLLSTAARLNSVQLHPLYDWFKTRLRMVGIDGWSPLYSARCERREHDAAEVEFLQAADLAVSDPRVVENEESDGIQKMFALAGPWIDVLAKGHVVVVDGLDDNLHPMLVRHLVERFHDSAQESDAQLVFTTHDTSILSQDVFRRDQIWFCERNERHETALVPLSDFRLHKGIENLERSYLAGRYGAVPYIQSA